MNVALYSYAGKLAYCIEPGKKISKEENGQFYSFSDDRFINKTEGVIEDKNRIGDLIKLIVANGYHTEVTGNNNTPTRVSLPPHDEHLRPTNSAFYTAFATQLLIWETVTGERKADFSYDGKERFALKYAKTRNGSYQKDILNEYNRIAAAVTSDIEHHDRANRTIAPKDNEIDLGTIELKLNTSNFCYEGKVSNENIKGCSLSIKNFPMEYIHINSETGTLSVSIPIKTAFEYQKHSYTGTLKKSEEHFVEEVSYTDISKMSTNIIIGGQQMLFFGNIPNKKTKRPLYQTNNYKLNFEIKVPEVHRHNWIPHRINPTCTTQGLMCWECSCGRVITANYAFNSGACDPTQYDFKTGIAPAENHDGGVTVTTVVPTCSESGVEQTLCTKCGVIIDTKEIPALGHTKEGEGSVWVVSKEPTAEAEGEMSLLCGKCSAVQKTKKLARHTHDSEGGEVVITAPTCTAAGALGTLCSACGAVYDIREISPKHGDTVEITRVAATCKNDGEAGVLCTDCGEILSTKVLPALGHTDDDVWFTAIEPACTADGEARKMCTRCGEVTDSKPVAALGHDDGVWTTTLEPTCELDGEKSLTCTRCGIIEDSKPIEKLGHDGGAWRVDIEATADHNGSMSLYCTRCGMVEETKTFEQHKHKKGYTKTLLQATCTRDGSLGTVCEICNAVYETKTLDAAGHSYAEPYKNGNGTHSMKCESCGYVFTQNCDFETVVHENTCCDIGYSVHTCTLCDYGYTDAYLKSKGHDYAKWENYNSSSHVRYCSRCPVAEYTLHVWGQYFHNNDNTSLDPGTKTRTCIYCGSKHTVKADDTCITTINTVADNSITVTLKLFEFFKQILAFAERVLRAIGIMH